ncbi:MAG: hypothetical protein ACRDCB_03520 [Clostridium sp.]|uniref:hypothetical protein n=1 Tax=Clostridium sp. TaxID=1506 RepID=UPI003EE4364E
MASSFDLPSSETFDKIIKITRKQTKEILENTKVYKFLPNYSKFDYLELKSSKFYDMSFRVVMFKISDNSYETIITNLDSKQFSPSDLKALYHMRWGIEICNWNGEFSFKKSRFHQTRNIC